MKTMKLFAIGAGVAVLSGGAWLYRRADAKEAPAYRFATVEHGNLMASVSATGALNAVRTVQVGTQVSGQVSAIYVDFNAKVKKGQLLARIDPTLQQQAVQDAQAGLDRVQAQLELARQDYDRNKQLFDNKIVTAAEFATVRANYSVAQANAKSASVAVSRARQNLAYTNIYSPIDGIIVERNVDVGQTVAASLSAPQLFLIANDLSQMQILASVDESDIGSIHEGQSVTFSVQSYPNRQFTGTVAQVRLQSKTQDNVVNYTVVVGVQNPGGVLLPGMTATLRFETGSADDALLVPNAALRFRPPSDVIAKVMAQSGVRRDSTRGAWGDSARGAWRQRGDSSGFAGRAVGANGQTRSASGVQTRGVVWYLGADQTLHAARVRIGLSDGQKTAVQSDSLKAGMQVITGSTAATTTTANASASANPLQPQGPRGGFGPGRF